MDTGQVIIDALDREAVRREVITRLADFPYPTPLNGMTFCDVLAAQRGRPIVIWPIPLIEIARRMGHDATKVPSGLWLADDHADHILHEEQTSAPHQQLIIFHEGAHILWGDRPAQVIPGCFDAGLYRNLNLARMRTVMHRRDYLDPVELRAEVTATELQLRAQLPATARRTAEYQAYDAPAEVAVRRLLADFACGGAP